MPLSSHLEAAAIQQPHSHFEKRETFSIEEESVKKVVLLLHHSVPR